MTHTEATGQEPSVVNGRCKPIYTDDPLDNAVMDFLDARANEWMKETDVVAATHAMVAVFIKWAPYEILERFRQQIEANLHLSFAEGGFRAWSEISDQQRALGNPLPTLPLAREQAA